jgi:hypothetical protein
MGSLPEPSALEKAAAAAAATTATHTSTQEEPVGRQDSEGLKGARSKTSNGERVSLWLAFRAL